MKINQNKKLYGKRERRIDQKIELDDEVKTLLKKIKSETKKIKILLKLKI